MPSNTRRPKSGHVYVLQAGRACKVGLARDPNQRLSSINTGRAEPAELFFTSPEMSYTRAQNVERWCHGHFKPLHIRGEWFRVSPYTCQAIVEILCSIGGEGAQAADFKNAAIAYGVEAELALNKAEEASESIQSLSPRWNEAHRAALREIESAYFDLHERLQSGFKAALAMQGVEYSDPFDIDL